MRSPLSSTLLLALCLAGGVARAAPEKGTVVQTDTLGLNVLSYDYDAHTTKTVADRVEPSEFVGLHYFFAPAWRIGLNLQFTERVSPYPPAGQGRFRTFAVLPQIGWHFYDPFFAALVLTLAPFIDGAANFTLGTQLVVGAGFSLASWVKLNLALEVPFNFVGRTNLGLTPLVGLSFKL